MEREGLGVGLAQGPFQLSAGEHGVGWKARTRSSLELG